MIDKNKLHFVLLLVFSFSLSPVRAQSKNVDQAIAFLRAACVTSGSSLEIKATGSGSIKLRSILGSGIKGEVSLNRTEAEGFANAASQISAQQANEMRNCMKPHIDKILTVLLN